MWQAAAAQNSATQLQCYPGAHPYAVLITALPATSRVPLSPHTCMGWNIADTVGDHNGGSDSQVHYSRCITTALHACMPAYRFVATITLYAERSCGLDATRPLPDRAAFLASSGWYLLSSASLVAD